MNPRKQQTLLIMRITSDVVMVTTSWVAAYYLRFLTPWFSKSKGLPDASLYFKLLPFIAAIWLGTFTLNGFYRRRQRTAFLEGLDIIQSSILANALFIVFTYFYEEYRYSRIALTIFAVISPAAMMAGRSAIRKALRIYRRNAAPRKTLIIGGGAVLEEALTALPQMELVGTEICGVLLTAANSQMTRQICQARKIPVLDQPPSDWPTFLIDQVIETVIVAVPSGDTTDWAEHLEAIADQVTDIKVIPDLQRFARLSTTTEVIQGIPVIHMHDSPLGGIGGLIKRFFDIVVTAAGLLILSPFLALVALGVKLSSPGPIFYKQERLGIDGKPFYMLKFRSMPIGAESHTGPVFATKTDNRATPFGRFMRKFSVDEFPQLFQVITGEMSLVGPRPERPVFVNDFRRKIPGYMLRHKVKAGVTGWAQVNGLRGDTSIEKRIQYDLYYIQHWSFWLDLKILMMTAGKVFWDRNAY